MVVVKKEILVGTIRVEAKTLNAYQKTKTSWKKVKKEFPELKLVVKLFKAQKRNSVLIDAKNPRFLKGQLSTEGLEQGARINILPNGEILEKAFSLFATHLRIHDQDSADHWDVLYQNRGGTWAYVYTLEKRKQHRSRKYNKVDQFEKKYSLLMSNVKKGLLDKNDSMAVPMYTLLTTYMRIGNEIYFNAHGHKGLTTLTKQDVRINNQEISFNYLGKDGVPIDIVHNFPGEYVARLLSLMKSKKRNEFVFSLRGHPLPEQKFKQAFSNYCGQEFYPHIVRSHYATTTVKKFIAGKKTLSKAEVEKLFLSLAHSLGHKKFNKKTQQWQEHYTVTVNSYIRPELVRKVQGMIR